METINDVFVVLSKFLWGWPMIVLLLGTHIFLTFRLRIPQRKLLTGIRLSVQKDRQASGDISQFGALATALAATIGTGNIVGVATAVALGGPGAVLWCWLTGVFGMSTKYAEGLLAVKFRVKDSNGRWYGGPMYVLEHGLGMKWLAVLFAVFTALASFGLGCTVQANSIALLTYETFGIDTWIVGLLVCVITGIVILGGVKIIARVCSILVPFMALFYVVWKANRTPREIFFIVAAAGLCVLLAGGVDDEIVKPLVARWRPTHDPEIGSLIDTVNGYRGGNYGFFSAHAANTFSLAVFFSLLMRHRLFVCFMVGWSLTNCYTRLYLGVHYPGDITVGLLWGGFVGWLVYRLYCRVTTPAKYEFRDLLVPVIVLCLTLLFGLIKAFFNS